MVKTGKYIYTFIFVTFFALAWSVSASAVVNYTDENTEFSQRTKEQVAAHYSAGKYAGDSYEDGNSNTYYKSPASVSSPYYQGILSDDTLRAMQGMTEFYRWLTGVDGLTEDCVQNESLQYQALDRYFEFNHVISNSSKPADMPQALWDLGFECDHNILAWNYTPQGAVTGWMNEGYNLENGSWDTYGHRYALVRPKNVVQQFGYCGNIAIGKYTQKNGHNYHEAFSAFPAAGYMPKGLVNANECGWHVDLNSSYLKITNASGVQVKITNDSTGTVYTRSVAEGSAQYSNPSLTFIQPRDAKGNRYSDNYTVEITGLTDAQTNSEATLTYHVKFFDESLYAATFVNSANIIGFEELAFYDGAVNTTYLKKAAAVLGMEVEVVTDTGRKMTLPVHGRWTLDETNHCYVNSVDASELPENVTDKRGILSRIVVPYNIKTNTYDRYNMLQVSKSNVLEGDSGYFRVFRSVSNIERIKLFKIKGDGTNGYYGTMAFDSATYNGFVRATNDYDYFNISSFKPEDSGEYISVFYYDGGGMLTEGKIGRPSISTVTLNVTRTSPETSTQEMTTSEVTTKEVTTSETTTKEVTTAETTTKEVTTQEQTTEEIVEGLEVNGCQVNANCGGVRTIYTVTDTIYGKKVVERGLTYGVGGYANLNDVTYGSSSEYVASFAADARGPMKTNHSNTLTAGTSYAMTLKFAAGTKKEFQTTWYVRAYAKLSDGTIVQGPINYYIIYDMADYFYQNYGMPTKEGHQYLYDFILKKVNPNYVEKNYIY